MIEDPKKGVIAWFVHNPVAANLAMLLIIVWGAFSAMTLPREGFPDIPSSRVTVEVEFPSGSPELTEEGVVLKVESALQAIPGIERLQAVSSADGATFSITKEVGYDIDQLLLDVKARVDAIPNLPLRAERPTITKESREEEEYLIWLQVHGPGADRATLETIAKDIQRELLRSRSVRRVDLAGSRASEIHIEVVEEALQRYGLSFDELAAAVDRESFQSLRGRLRSEHGELALKADAQAYRPEDFRAIPVMADEDGVQVRLGDVAEVKEGFAEAPHTWMRFRGDPAIGMQVHKSPIGEADEARLLVEDLIAEWSSSGRLPEGIALTTWDDQGIAVDARISLMMRNAILGALIVFLILALTIDHRVAFWVALGLPVAFGGAMILMGSSFLGLTLNELTTFGMIVALGIVVDDAVVVGESVYAERRRRGRDLVDTVRGVHRVAIPTVFGVLTTVAAFSVLPFVDGQMGQVFAQFATVISLVLVFSILESKLILPAHLAAVRLEERPRGRLAQAWGRLRNGIDRKFDAAARAYRRALGLTLRWRYVSLLLALTIAMGIFGFLQRGAVRMVFFPDIPGQVVTANLQMEEGVGYGLTESHLNNLEQALFEAAAAEGGELPRERFLPAIQVSQGDDGSGTVLAELAADQERVTPEGLIAAWRERVEPMVGVRSLVFTADFEGDDDSIRVEFTAPQGYDMYPAMRELELKLRQAEDVMGIVNEASLGRSELTFRLTERGRAAGFTAADLANQVQQAFSGYEVQRVQRGAEEVRVRIRYPQEQRRTEADLKDAWVRDAQGVAYPLSAVATFGRGRTPTFIERIDHRRVSTVSFLTDEERLSTSEAVALLEGEMLPDILAKYPQVQVKFAGEAEEIEKTQQSFQEILLLAVGLIYMLLAIPLKSYTLPLVIMAVIPFGMLGAVVGHWLHGVTMSLLSMFGMLALAGVVVNDSLLLVVTYQRARQVGLGRHEALQKAGGSRLRAIVLTSLTTYAGLIPLVLETSEQAQYLIPAALSLAYGVLFATTLTLGLVPILIAIGGDLRRVLGTGTSKPKSEARYQA